MRKHVLLVEDEANIIEAVRFLLTRDGWHVEAHADGNTAMARIVERQPDLVILDLMLPGKSGLDILRDLRGNPTFAELPVLMLTARGQEQDRDLAAQAGASRFMTKPFSNVEVLEAVRELAAQ
ncbi:response regulator [Aliishimia ponticola]|uniref:Response regulator n=1 Tax=Aliishimia ponticola TaxID=2499833 RepID=A0A4S4NIN4_9RHOB|nr:response regulator [Aliishimia ponticola]THH38078.1 response regulator [Aliishimia ponticola]